MRRRRILPVVVVAVLAICAWTFLAVPLRHRLEDRRQQQEKQQQQQAQQASPLIWGEDEQQSKSRVGPGPRPAPATAHPIALLVGEAEREFEAMRARQSRTLAQAVAEYRRRYGIAPPPNFDKWFAFARERAVELVDEFDMVHDMLRPFWGLRPATIRARVRDALGLEANFLIGIRIRDGRVAHAKGQPDWQREATAAMLAKFGQHLPPVMDLAFNVHDEPRVVLPHDDLARLLRAGADGSLAGAGRRAGDAVNAFTRPPEPEAEAATFAEAKLTRFNVFAHQATWTHSRLSCPPDSPARALEDADAADDRSRYGLGELGFVYNATAMSDVCLTPSLSRTHGFFDRPNAYNVALELVPVFSQSKISSYADILYPSPWYWDGRVKYNEGLDVEWAHKRPALYWRGSTTGGFSRDGGWRRQHRQHLVRKLNSATQALILVNKGAGVAAEAGEQEGQQQQQQKQEGQQQQQQKQQQQKQRRQVPGPGQEQDRAQEQQAQQPSPDPKREQKWEPVEVPRGDYRDAVDVHFSHVGQCDPGDCDAQRQFFSIHDAADQQDAWGYRYLLDVDGNAFSGRFYAFLRSRSLVFKLAIFREWHAEWVRPWAHYVPLSLQGDDWLEAVRYFGAGATADGGGGGGGGGEGGGSAGGGGSKTGGDSGEQIATRSREWAGKTLRNEDMEVWFFRLLLEYGRVIDDNRESIGFSL